MTSSHTDGIDKAIAIFSDASFCSETGAGAGAYWIKSGEVELSAGHGLKGVQQPHDAEVLAACKAIDAAAAHPTLFSRLRLGAKTQLLLYVDCDAVIQVLTNRRPVRLSAAAQKAVDSVRALIARLGCKLQVFHVKAHSGVNTPQKRHNRWCDARSRTSMRSIRGNILNLLKKKQKPASVTKGADGSLTLNIPWTPPKETGRPMFAVAPA